MLLPVDQRSRVGRSSKGAEGSVLTHEHIMDGEGVSEEIEVDELSQRLCERV